MLPNQQPTATTPPNPAAHLGGPRLASLVIRPLCCLSAQQLAYTTPPPRSSQHRRKPAAERKASRSALDHKKARCPTVIT